jgi:putative sugar O-methyltransferase
MENKNQALIENFKKTCDFFYNNKDNIDQKSSYWTRYDFKKFNLENLINFRSNDSLSSGLDDQVESLDFKIYAKVVKEISEEYLLKNLPKKNIGNCKTLLEYKDILIDYNKLIHIHWFSTIEKEVLKKNKIMNLCEIGGGFGSFSELFVRNYNIKLISIDLPEAGLMTSYYLQENFPEKKFYLFKDYSSKNILSYEQFLSNDIIILPPNCNYDPKIKIDFFVNARSMMEMNYNIIKTYFDFIQNHCHENSFFLNINRYEKNSVGKSIKISEYPYDNNWKVIISKPSFNQNWIHFLLTQRTLDKNISDIKVELEKIKKLGEKFYGMYQDYTPRFIFLKKLLRKFLKIFFLDKVLNIIGKIFLYIGNKLRNFK